MKYPYIVFIYLTLIFSNSDPLVQIEIPIEQIKDSKRIINFQNENQKNINFNYMNDLGVEKNTPRASFINSLDENLKFLSKKPIKKFENQSNKSFSDDGDDIRGPAECPQGSVADCSGDGDCIPESWIGDGFCDNEDQLYDADLTCYDNDGGDCCADRLTFTDVNNFDLVQDIDSCFPSEINSENPNVGYYVLSNFENVDCSFDIYVNGWLQPQQFSQYGTDLIPYWYKDYDSDGEYDTYTEFYVGFTYTIEIIYSDGILESYNFSPTCNKSCEDFGLYECNNSLYGGGDGFYFNGNSIINLGIWHVDSFIGNQSFNTLNSAETIEFCEEYCRSRGDCKGFELLERLVCDSNSNGVVDSCNSNSDDGCVSDLFQSDTDSPCEDGSEILTIVNTCKFYDEHALFYYDYELINTNNAFALFDYCSYDECPINDCSEDSQYLEVWSSWVDIEEYGDGVIDDCGVCNGNNLSCSDCSGIPYGNSYCFDIISSFDVPNDQGGYVYINWAPHTLDKKLWTKLEGHSINTQGQRYWVDAMSSSSSLEDLTQECKNFCADASGCHAFVLKYDIEALDAEYNSYCTFYGEYSTPSPISDEFIGNSDTYIYSSFYNTEHITDYLVYKYNPNNRGWELIHQAPARQFEDYSFTAPTNQTSIPNQDLIYETEYFVSALSSTGQYYNTEHILVHSIDNLSPSTPTMLNGEFENNSVVLSWTPNEESDFREYNLYRNGSFLNSSIENFFVDNTFTHGGQNQYSVSAVDLYYNESGLSLTVNIETPLIGDSTQDGAVNVLDIVMLVEWILLDLSLTDVEIATADMTNDNVVNILDIVALVEIILNP